MRPTYLIPVAAVAVLFLAGPGLAHDHGDRGDRDERGEREDRGQRGERKQRRARAVTPPSPAEALYRKECGACHLAYPPRMLPAASWRATMAGLERHFGQNAELDQETGAALEGWLVGNAAESRRRKRIDPSVDGEAPLRISGRAGFQRKHRKIDAGVLARPSIRSIANCAACHTRAEAWDFEEDAVRIPGR